MALVGNHITYPSYTLWGGPIHGILPPQGGCIHGHVRVSCCFYPSVWWHDLLCSSLNPFLENGVFRSIHLIRTLLPGPPHASPSGLLPLGTCCREVGGQVFPDSFPKTTFGRHLIPSHSASYPSFSCSCSLVLVVWKVGLRCQTPRVSCSL